jgi:hypothetical protein
MPHSLPSGEYQPPGCAIFKITTALLIAAAIAGCESRPGDNFQTFDQKRQQGYVPPETFPSDVDEAEPIVADVVAEDSAAAALPDQPTSAFAPLNVVDGTKVAAILGVADISSADLPADATAAIAAVPVAPRKVELLVKSKEFKPEGPQKALRVNYDDLDLLKILNMDPVTPDAPSLFPAWLTGLDGEQIRIRGYMYPTFQATGLEQFVLARDTQLCCFGRNPKVYDLIAVELKPGTTSDYIHLRAFDVIGTLRIEMQVVDGEPYSLYWIENATVVQ